MWLDLRKVVTLANHPERLIPYHLLFLTPIGVEGNFFMKIHVVGKYKNLFDVPCLRPDFVKQSFDEATDNEKDVTIKTGYGIVKDHDSVVGNSTFRVTTFDELEEIQKRHKGFLPLA